MSRSIALADKIMYQLTRIAECTECTHSLISREYPFNVGMTTNTTYRGT